MDESKSIEITCDFAASAELQQVQRAKPSKFQAFRSCLDPGPGNFLDGLKRLGWRWVQRSCRPRGLKSEALVLGLQKAKNTVTLSSLRLSSLSTALNKRSASGFSSSSISVSRPELWCCSQGLWTRNRHARAAGDSTTYVVFLPSRRVQELELSVLVFRSHVLPAELHEGLGDHLAQSIRTTHQDLTEDYKIEAAPKREADYSRCAKTQP